MSHFFVSQLLWPFSKSLSLRLIRHTSESEEAQARCLKGVFAAVSWNSTVSNFLAWLTKQTAADWNMWKSLMAQLFGTCVPQGECLLEKLCYIHSDLFYKKKKNIYSSLSFLLWIIISPDCGCCAARRIIAVTFFLIFVTVMMGNRSNNMLLFLLFFIPGCPCSLKKSCI